MIVRDTVGAGSEGSHSAVRGVCRVRTRRFLPGQERNRIALPPRGHTASDPSLADYFHTTQSEVVRFRHGAPGRTRRQREHAARDRRGLMNRTRDADNPNIELLARATRYRGLRPAHQDRARGEERQQ